MKTIVVGGGCFWGVQEYYRRIKGIVETRVGYAQGKIDNPTYEEVKSQVTDHREVVEVMYNELEISLEKIIELLFRIIDPTIQNRQADDIGTQYQCGIYYSEEADKEKIVKYVDSLRANYSNPLTIEIEELRCFYDAEEYHQLYLVKNPTGYCHVDFGKIREDELK